MTSSLPALFDLHAAPRLLEFVEHVFQFSRDDTRRVKQAMAYQFTPRRRFFPFRGLTFEAILNQSRYDYVQEYLKNIEHADPARESESSEEFPRAMEATSVHIVGSKRALLPHMPPPGMKTCPLDNLDASPLFVARLNGHGKQYALVVNNRPWGYQQTMLVTIAPEPQRMTERDLHNSLLLLAHLGPDYEGIFTGVGAGASIYHFHLQVHKGASVIWRNIDEHAVRLTEFDSSNDVRACRAEGWPAQFFLFEASDIDPLARAIQRMIDLFVRGDNDYPYNIGFRYQNETFRLILFPKSNAQEKPTGVNPYPDSWGRFSFLEMGGGIYLLTPEGYKATVHSPQGLYDAIAHMSIEPDQLSNLIQEYRSTASETANPKDRDKMPHANAESDA